MKNLIKYNIAKFKTGSLFLKFFMVTLWPFCLFMIFNPFDSDGTLASQGGSAWVVIVFIMIFGLFFPIRNWIGVKRILDNVDKDPSFKDKYRDLLKELKK